MGRREEDGNQLYHDVMHSCKLINKINYIDSIFEIKQRVDAMEKEIKPPAKYRVVLTRFLGPLVSFGEFDSNGRLRCFNRDDGSLLTAEWCDYIDRNHHSPGWKREWEPKGNYQ